MLIIKANHRAGQKAERADIGWHPCSLGLSCTPSARCITSPVKKFFAEVTITKGQTKAMGPIRRDNREIKKSGAQGTTLFPSQRPSRTIKFSLPRPYLLNFASPQALLPLFRLSMKEAFAGEIGGTIKLTIVLTLLLIQAEAFKGYLLSSEEFQLWHFSHHQSLHSPGTSGSADQQRALEIPCYQATM